MIAKKPTTIDEARVRALAFSAGVMADQVLGLRQRLQEVCDELYPLLQLADPATDRALELFLVQLCRMLNELHDAHALKFKADLLQRFRIPHESVQVPDLFFPQVPSPEGCPQGGVGSADPHYAAAERGNNEMG